jgi:hypothetical protein
LTSISSATAFTPLTRLVAFSAPSLGLVLHMSSRDYASICRASICAASTPGSHLNSSTTSLLRSLSDDMISPGFGDAATCGKRLSVWLSFPISSE